MPQSNQSRLYNDFFIGYRAFEGTALTADTIYLYKCLVLADEN